MCFFARMDVYYAGVGYFDSTGSNYKSAGIINPDSWPGHAYLFALVYYS